MTTRVHVGDVFIVPIGDGRVGIGQVVAGYGRSAYFFAIFEPVILEQDVPSMIPAAVAGAVRLFALSFDALIHVGHWPVVSRAPVRDDLPLPAYKEAVTTPDHIDVVDYTGTRRRRATKDEVDVLPYRGFVAPFRLELALRANVGIGPWLADFDELLPHGPTSREFFA